MKTLKIKRREIISERRVTVRFGNSQREMFCPACRRQSPFVAVDQAALFCGTTSLAIFRRIESGRVHALETTEGFLIVCLTSIAAGEEEEEKNKKQQEEFL